ncbi:glycosyltransferase family 4 protein [Candidatus Berkelbacteria bacterium]|nr:glycosyltransferase family 4 protein [Candidatus Berkelbacteria bacterium]
MKILMLLKYPLFGSGSGTYARKLAEKLAEDHPKDSVAVFCPNKENIKLKNVKIYNFDLPFTVASTGHPSWPNAKQFHNLNPEEVDELFTRSLAQVLKVIHDFRPDVIHVHHALYLTWVADYIRAVYGTYFVTTIHGTGLLTATQDKRWIPLTKSALSRSAFINAVSGDTKKWLLKIYKRRGIDRQIRIITGGIDLQNYPKRMSTQTIEKKYKLKGKKVVIFVGKLEKHKGVEYLLRAAPKIKGEIFILGSGEDQDRLQGIAKDLKLRNVHFLGYFGPEYVRELKEFYRRASVFVFPSTWDEPLGLVALEAMASYTPVVASNKGGIPLAVKNGVNGYLVRARSSKQISDRVNKILDDPELESKLGQAARKIVEEKFDWKFIAERFYTYYQRANAQSKKRLKRMNLPLDYAREKQEIKGKRLGYI